MARLWYLSHPEVVIDPARPVPDWGLNEIGRARVQAWLMRGAFSSVGRIVASTERKARETAAPIAAALRLALETRDDLGENDRSATGFLPADAFDVARLAFFGAPAESYQGWERALDAQARVAAATAELVARHAGRGDLLLVGHGGVGTLLWCHRAGAEISADHDQVPGGGCVWSAPLEAGPPDGPWQRVEDTRVRP